MKTLAEIKKSILLLVQKNPGYQGYFTDEKMNEHINEALDYISVDMFQTGEGWLREIRYLDWVSGSRVIEIPQDVGIINNVRWKQGDVFYPLRYDPADFSAQAVKGTGTGVPTVYRIVQNKLFMNPEPSDSGTAQLELEFSRYPMRLVSESQEVMPDFDNSMLNYLKYYVANTLLPPSAQNQKFKDNEEMWYKQMLKVVTLRNRVSKVIGDFGGN